MIVSEKQRNCQYLQWVGLKFILKITTAHDTNLTCIYICNMLLLIAGFATPQNKLGISNCENIFVLKVTANSTACLGQAHHIYK